MAEQYGTWDRNLVQMGIQPAATPVPATTVWRSVFSGWDDGRVRETVEEQVGLDVPSERRYDSYEAATVAFPDTPLTFEQLPHLLEMGLLAATPSGAGPYVHEYEVPTDGSARALKYRTLEIGNVLATTDIHQIPLCWASEIKIKGSQGEAWMMGATVEGQRAIGGHSFTSSIALPDVTEALFNPTSFYIDDGGGTIGTTQVEGVVTAFDMTIQTGVQWVKLGDGNLYPSRVKIGKPTINFTMSFELLEETAGPSSVVDTERTAYEADTTRLIRVVIDGPSTNEFQIDMAAKWDKPGPYEQADNINTIVPFEGHAAYSSVDALFFVPKVTNSIASY